MIYARLGRLPLRRIRDASRNWAASCERFARNWSAPISPLLAPSPSVFSTLRFAFSRVIVSLPSFRGERRTVSFPFPFLFRIFLISSSNFSLSSCARFSNVSLPAICRSLQFTPSTFRKARVDGNMRIVNVGI